MIFLKKKCARSMLFSENDQCKVCAGSSDIYIKRAALVRAVVCARDRATKDLCFQMI